MAAEDKTYQQYLNFYKSFCAIRNEQGLARLLNTDQRNLLLLAKQPKYQVFTVPKRGGGKRNIENPDFDLKNMQSRLNKYLQSTYYFEKSTAAYGFIANARDERTRRDIITNAQQHLGKPYLVNIDLKDFFHSVKYKKVEGVFSSKPFFFETKLTRLLTQLTTYNRHLPMGTPTSPVLSNFACLTLDDNLLELSKQEEWKFTRYADDMSFSSDKPITDEHLEKVNQLIEQEGFKMNTRKLKRYGKEDDKEVTGLLLTDRVELNRHFIPELEKELEQLKEVMEIQNLHGNLRTYWVEQFKNRVRGKINFVGYVMGRNYPDYSVLNHQFREAIHPPEADFGALSWRSFPYA